MKNLLKALLVGSLVVGASHAFADNKKIPMDANTTVADNKKIPMEANTLVADNKKIPMDANTKESAKTEAECKEAKGMWKDGKCH